MLSVVCLLLYSAGFIRIELKFNDHDQRLMAIEEVISQIKHGMAITWNKKLKTTFNRAFKIELFSKYLATAFCE